jgi:hypothetical protein
MSLNIYQYMGVFIVVCILAFTPIVTGCIPSEDFDARQKRRSDAVEAQRQHELELACVQGRGEWLDGSCFFQPEKR